MYNTYHSQFAASEHQKAENLRRLGLHTMIAASANVNKQYSN